MKINNIIGAKKFIAPNQSFGAVSIDPQALYRKPNGLIISEGSQKIDELSNDRTAQRVEMLANNIDSITEEMKIRRKIAEEKPWWYRTQAAIRNITRDEAVQKNEKIQELDSAVNQYVDRTKKIEEIANSVEKEVNSNFVDYNIERMKTHREFDDYKGNFTKVNGFSRIAGYDTEKMVLDKYFISEIKKEQNGEKANVPNAVLFFGPTGNGKTTFAKAFANETGCRLAAINISVDKLSANDSKKNFYNKLFQKAQQSEEYFQKTGKRTIIFIDEITKVADKNSPILPELDEFLKTCSKKYHCTVFCATNHPLDIGLDTKSIFPFIISLDPPSLSNKAKIMQYYLSGCINDSVDFDMLAQYLEQTETKKQGLFNITQIKDDICLEGNNKNLKSEDIIQNIDNLEPSITRKDLDKYSREMDELIKNEVTE